jgi:GNAT superfamily N-acetyltransferase
MEIANLDEATIRLATAKDSEGILHLLNEAAYTHIHADWHVPGDWLDTPGFVVSEGRFPSKSFTHFGRSGRKLMACLAAAADPYPAAWVRLAAIRQRPFAQENLAALMDAVLPYLVESGVTELGWLAVESWPDELLRDFGFQRMNWITTFIKEGLDIPRIPECDLQIRPVRPEDMEFLAVMEAEAYDPLWRHSAESLRLAYGQSICFDVALLEEQIVGFQKTASNNQGSGAHQVRITVHPSYQGNGVGSALMKAAIEEYRKRGLRRVSLNTQLDNIASHQLYEKFGFYQTGDQLPVWVLEL